jgi:hypothetical protein
VSATPSCVTVERMFGTYRIHNRIELAAMVVSGQNECGKTLTAEFTCRRDARSALAGH